MLQIKQNHVADKAETSTASATISVDNLKQDEMTADSPTGDNPLTGMYKTRSHIDLAEA